MTVFPLGMVIRQRFTNVSCQRAYQRNKIGGGFLDPRSLNLLGEDGICVVNRLEIEGIINCVVLLCFVVVVVFFLLHD